MECRRNPNTDSLEGKELRSVIVLSFVFLCVFTAFISIQNLQSSINEEGGLGIISLLCVYIFSTLSNIFAPLAIKILTAKWVIIVSCASHLLYAISNFYPRLYTLVPTSILLGCITGPFWTSQGMYITTCSFKYAERTKKNASHILGKFFSVFFFIYVWSSIIGNLLSSVLLNLKSDKPHNLNITLTLNISNTSTSAKCCNRCVIEYCPRTEIIKDKPEESSQDKASLYYLLGAFVTCVFIGLLIASILLPPIPRGKPRGQSTSHSSLSSLASCGTLLRKPTLLLLVPSFVAFSWAETFRWTDVTNAFISCMDGVSVVGYVLAAHGFCSGVSTFLMSKVAKYIGRHRLIVILYITYISVFVGYYFTPESRPISLMAVIVCLHGIMEGPISAQLQATLGWMHGNSKEAAFANLGAWKCVSSALYFSISNSVCVRIKVILLLVLYILALPTYIGAELLFRKQRKETEIEIEVTETLKDNKM
ncbi:hypothetical protein FSP39_016480 [Pinctada imbricata]|uniref:UNC93-like protein n=1 Tax=Pinctada imbricata TaxID=66713 RepID=A0AA88YJY3_PINIB|nr:hypothetical protein FSP39_016480 [Pinctada imbricata]